MEILRSIIVLSGVSGLYAPVRRRPHVMVQSLDDVRGVMAFLVGHGVEGAALTQLVTSAKGLLSIRRPVLALRMRMLKEHLGGNALVREFLLILI